jgi:MraZ protein
VALFLSTFVNKVDRKGRVSVPASFRGVLAEQSFNGIVAFRSFKSPAIEGSGIARLDEISASLAELNEFSEDYDSLSWIFADTQQIPCDSEGRIILPDFMIEHAGITESAAFVGLGRNFQIWEPTAYTRHQDEMRDRAKRHGVTLPGRRPGTPPAAAPAPAAPTTGETPT